MNRVVLFEQDQINNDQFLLQDRIKVEHLLSHLKIKVGDQLKATIINHGLVQVRVTSIQGHQITLEKESSYERPNHPNLALVIATSRPPTMKKVIEHGTTLGVKSFHFFTAELSEKSYLKSKVLEEEKLQELASLGVSQSGCLWEMPRFKFSQNLTQALQSQEEESSKLYLLSLKGKQTLLEQNPSFKESLAFFIGPERGWTQKEEKYLIENKVNPLLLSKHILRVETAAFALLSQMELLQLS